MICAVEEGHEEEGQKRAAYEGELAKDSAEKEIPTERAPVKNIRSYNVPGEDKVATEGKSDCERSDLPPPVIEMTPQPRKEIRMAKVEARNAERKLIAKEIEEAWKALVSQATLVIQTAERARQRRCKFAAAKAKAAVRNETLCRQEGQPIPELEVTDQ